MMGKTIAIASLVLVLCLVNWSILGKEKHLAEGRVVYLHLAPVDPRSLLQGDYMALHFRLADEVYKTRKENIGQGRHEVAPSDGYVVAGLDERDIGTFKGLYNGRTLSDGEILLRYRVRNGAVKLATNAYFFQEGHAKYYQPARYGKFRVDIKGELLLVAMYDKGMNKLEPKKK